MPPSYRFTASLLILWVVLAADVRGQQLLEVDGIELRDAAQPRSSHWSMVFDLAAFPPTANAAAGAAGSPAAQAPTPSTGQRPPATATPEQENIFWKTIADSENPAEFEAYLKQFPNGVFRALAKARLAALRGAGGLPAVGGRDATPRVAEVAVDARAPGDVFRDCDGCPEMVVIPAGSFQMGCVSGIDCDDGEQPVHTVTISRPFALSRYEVTFEEYERFAVATGRSQPDDAGWGRGRRPVVNVSWYDAQEYASWLSSETGRRYRLPSEAEWEYAARAAKTTAYWWGNEAGQSRTVCDGCGSQWTMR